MKGRIAVEPALSDVKQYLAGQGYSVENMNPNDRSPNKLNMYDAIVVTGLSTNLLGLQDTETKAVVINADGLTPPEVAQRIGSIKS